MEQRAGRIIRQGNENSNVKVFRYVTEGTFDSYLWQIIENKQRFISQIMTSKSPARSAEDVDQTTLNFAEIKALAAGNPLIKEKMEVDNKLSRLRTARRDFLKSREHLQRKVNEKYPYNLRVAQEKFEKIQADIETVKSHSAEGYSIIINDQTFTDRQKATEYIKDALQKRKGSLLGFHGEFKGLKFFVEPGKNAYDRDVWKLEGEHNKMTSRNVTQVPGSNLNCIEDLVDKLSINAETLTSEISDLQQKIKAGKAELQIPFPQEEEFQKLSVRSAEISTLLDLDSSRLDQEKQTDE